MLFILHKLSLTRKSNLTSGVFAAHCFLSPPFRRRRQGRGRARKTVTDSSMARGDSRTTVHDSVLHVICSIHGLQIAARVPKWLRYVTMIFWTVVFSTVLTTIREMLAVTVYEPGRVISSSDISCYLCAIVDISASIYVIVTFLNRQKSFEQLLRKNGRGFGAVYSPLALALPWIIFTVYYAVKMETIELRLSFISLLFILTSGTTFLMIYVDIAENLIEASEDLWRWSQDTGQCSDGLLRAKWELREKIRVANELCSLPMLAHYIHLGLLVLYVFSRTLAHGPDVYDFMGYLSHVTGYFLAMFYFAHRSSMLEKFALGTEKHILRQALFDKYRAPDMRRVFRFNGEVDVLRVGCYPHNSKNFMKMLGALVTCVAAVLQFDYTTTKKINELASEAAK